MAHLLFTKEDIKYIQQEMEEYDIPIGRLEEIKQRIKSTMESWDYWYEEIRRFAEEEL